MPDLAERDRRVVMVEVNTPIAGAPSAGMGFAERHGFAPALVQEHRVLDLPATEGRWPGLAAEVAPAHADYELVTWFDTVPDGHYDLAFMRWHLIHIPRGPEKSKYLANLKRISKAFVILEPVNQERVGTIHSQMDGHFLHSWDNWGLDYDLTEHKARTFMENTTVYYSKQRR